MRENAGLTFMVSLTIALQCLFSSSVQAASYRIDDVERLRWIDPLGREPMTYEEYMEAKGDPGPFIIEHVYSGSGRGRDRDSLFVSVVVNADLYSDISDSLAQYANDIELEGYSVSIHTSSGGTPSDLRAFLQGLQDSLVGAVFIGDLPVAWYEMEDWGHEEFPIDLYYMDLDGAWSDSDVDGLFDVHSGSVEPDVWVGRLTASPLSLGGADEATLVNGYFHRNHQYRTGVLSTERRALVYVDDDWAGGAEEWSENVGLAYWDRTLVAHPETTRAQDYENRLDVGYEWIQVCAHSSPSLHAFKYLSGGLWDYFYNDEILDVDPVAFFFNLFACSNARYVEGDYMGGWYVFNPAYGLAALGSTKTGSMLYFEEFYQPLRQNKCLGEAFKEWFTAVGEQSRPWFYGMTLLGDPLLNLRRDLNVVRYYVDDDNSGGSSGNGSGTVDPGETIELAVTLVSCGRETLEGVTATLSSTDTFVTVLDDFEEYGSIDPADSTTSLEDYDFEVDGSCPRGHRIPFTLSISDGSGGTWIDGFSIVVEQPEVTYFSGLVTDTLDGDGDGDADPGETLEMRVVLANNGLGQTGGGHEDSGHDKATGISVELSTEDEYLTVTLGTSDYENISPGDTSSSLDLYGFVVDERCPYYHWFNFGLDITADGGYTNHDSFVVVIGDRYTFCDSVENGAIGWSHYEVTPGYVDGWHLDSEENHTLGGNTSWKCGATGSGFYSDLSDAGLVTPEMELGSDGFLHFWHRIDAETDSDTTAWDGAMVEIDDGDGWQQIYPEGGYPYTTVGGAEGPFPEGTPCFSGDHPWSDVFFDLSAYSGSIRLRFRFGSDVGTAREGWYVDDVSVWSVLDSAGLEVSQVIADADSVSWGAADLPVDVVLANGGGELSLVDSVRLTFRGESGNLDDEYARTLVDSIPLLNPFSTDTVAFSVDVASPATVGWVTVDAVVFGRDGRSQELLFDTAAAVPDSWYVREAELFIRGDGNADSLITMSDAIHTLRHLYVPGSEQPPCMKAADSDDDGEVAMSDAIYTLRYLYVPGSPQPPLPFPDCDTDPTSDTLSCAGHPCSGTVRHRR